MIYIIVYKILYTIYLFSYQVSILTKIFSRQVLLLRTKVFLHLTLGLCDFEDAVFFPNFLFNFKDQPWIRHHFWAISLKIRPLSAYNPPHIILD